MVKDVNLEDVERVGVVTDEGEFMEPVDSDHVRLDRDIVLHINRRKVPEGTKLEKATIKIHSIDGRLEVDLEEEVKIGEDYLDSVNIEMDLEEVLENLDLDEMDRVDVEYCPLCGEDVEDGEEEYSNCDNCGSNFVVR